MNDHFGQLNQMMQNELERLGRPKKRLRFLACLGLTLILFSAIILFDIPGQSTTVIASVKNAASGLKAATLMASPTIFFSSGLDQPKNILFLGRAGQGNDAPDLTDTILLVMLKPNPARATLISIPRDLFVKMPGADQSVKINSLFAQGKAAKNEDQGIELIKQKVEELTGQKIDDYFLVDLTVVKDVVDTLGGLNVDVAKDLVDTSYPGPNHSYQTFSMQAGWRYLDGETTLEYVRSRHSLNGDFDRIVRQQEVIAALKQKVAGLNPLLDFPKILGVLQDLSAHIKTNVPISEFPAYWQIAKSLPTDQINKIVIDNRASDLLVSVPIQYDNGPAYVLEPKGGIDDYSAIQKFILDNQ